MDQSKYNIKSPGIKRLMREAVELAEPTEDYSVYPLEDNLFEWHFTVRGAPSTEFEDGIYHGRIILPTQYPMKPPDIILLTPNGRFETNKKICLSISGHHPESWQPSWSIRTALLALIAFMPTKTIGSIGSLDYSPDERRILAKKSKEYVCEICGKISDKFKHNKGTLVLSAAETSLMNDITTLSDSKNDDIQESKTISSQNEDIGLSEIVENIENEEEIAPSPRSNYLLPYVIIFIVAAIFILLSRRLITLKNFVENCSEPDNINGNNT